jgi:hypothetical protein
VKNICEPWADGTPFSDQYQNTTSLVHRLYDTDRLDRLSRGPSRGKQGRPKMPARVEKDIRIPPVISKIYNEMHISPVDLLRKYALTYIHGRIQKYEAENSFFERKYESVFDSFKRKVTSIENEEDFEWDDDLMDWEFAVSNLDLWRKRAQEIASE